MESALAAQRELEAAIASGTLALDDEIAAREELRRLTNAIEQAQGRVTAAIETGTSALREQAALLADALALDLERNGLLTEAIRSQERLLRVARDQNRPLEERTEAMREANRLAESIGDHMRRALQPALGLAGAAQAFSTGLRALPDAARGTVESMYDLGDAGEESAGRFEDEWLSAINIVGAQLGGIASQAANAITAFVTGGPWAGAAATAGAVVGIISGRRAEDEFERAARDWEDRLDRFAALFRVEGRFEAMERELEEQTLAALERSLQAMVGDMPRFIRSQFGDDMVEHFMEVFQTGGVEALEAMFGPMEDMHPALRAFIEEMIAATERLEEARARAQQSMEDDLSVRLLVAQGRDEEAEAMRREIRRREELAQAMDLGGEEFAAWVAAQHEAIDVALEAAEAERELAEARRQAEMEMNVVAREMALWGSDLQAFTASAEAAAEAERNRVRAMIEAGEISEELGQRLLRVIDAELTQSIDAFNEQLRETARAAWEAAEAERFRQGQDLQSLQLRILRAQGRDREAQQLQNLMELERAMFDGRDQQYLQLLQMAQAEEARAAAMRGASRSMERMNDSLRNTSRELNAPQGLPTALLRFISAREVSGSGGGSSRTSGGAQARQSGTTTQDFGVAAASPSFSGPTPSDVHLAGSESLESELARITAAIEGWTWPPLPEMDPVQVVLELSDLPDLALETGDRGVSIPSTVELAGTNRLEDALADLRESVDAWQPPEPWTAPAPVRPPVQGQARGSTVQSVTVDVGGIHITQQPGEDAEALARRVALAVQKIAQDGGGNLFDTTGV
jgi:hypothetical protein